MTTWPSTILKLSNPRVFFLINTNQQRQFWKAVARNTHIYIYIKTWSFDKETTDAEKAALKSCVSYVFSKSFEQTKQRHHFSVSGSVGRLRAPRFSGVRGATLQPTRSAADTRTSPPCCRNTTSEASPGGLCDRDRNLWSLLRTRSGGTEVGEMRWFLNWKPKSVVVHPLISPKTKQKDQPVRSNFFFTLRSDALTHTANTKTDDMAGPHRVPGQSML